MKHTILFACTFSAVALTAGTVTVAPTGRYLAVPVQNGAPKILLEVFDGGTRVAYDQVEWARGATNWTGSLDLRGFAGRLLEFRFSGENVPNISAVDLAFADARFPAPKGQYGEAWRPQFHFTPPLGWNNDPNGLSYRDGEWHMFYQHNPFGVRWGNMHWGHAVSKDLVRWTDLGDVIAPDDHGPMFSGSAVTDHANTSGFGKGAHVLVYTAAGKPHTQRIAWSLDGRNYAKWPKAAVEGRVDANRDPKVVWYVPGKFWVLAVYGEVEAGRHGVSIFTSPNLKDWTFASNVRGDLFDEGRFLYECPDFFELPIQGETGTRWVLTAANRQYAIGSFDGRTFIPEATRLEQTRPVDGLNPVYAWQSFSDAPDGRRIQMAWSHFDTLAGGRTDVMFNARREGDALDQIRRRAGGSGVRLHARGRRDRHARPARRPGRLRRGEEDAVGERPRDGVESGCARAAGPARVCGPRGTGNLLMRRLAVPSLARDRARSGEKEALLAGERREETGPRRNRTRLALEERREVRFERNES